MRPTPATLRATAMSKAAPSDDPAVALRHDWHSNARWAGITRAYTAEDVVRLRGTIGVDHTIARLTAVKLWNYLQQKPYVNALGALTGN